MKAVTRLRGSCKETGQECVIKCYCRLKEEGQREVVRCKGLMQEWYRKQGQTCVGMCSSVTQRCFNMQCSPAYFLSLHKCFVHWLTWAECLCKTENTAGNDFTDITKSLATGKALSESNPTRIYQAFSSAAMMCAFSLHNKLVMSKCWFSPSLSGYSNAYNPVDILSFVSFILLSLISSRTPFS